MNEVPMSNVIAQPRPAPFRLIREARRPWPARRVLQIILGLIWLLDAALQFQPYMFSRAFVTKTIEPVATGNPAVIAGPILWSAHLMARHIVLYNAAFAAVQLVIAAGFFVRPAVRLALAASIVWAVFVWWFGEGLGGLLTGGSPLAGLPGAVILYALIALLVWPNREDDGADDPGRELAPALGGAAGPGLAPRGAAGPGLALRGPLGRLVPRLIWVLLWVKFAWYLILAANRAPNTVSQIFAAAAGGQPGWVRAIENNLASLTAGRGLAVSILLAAACGAAGLGIFAGRLARPALVLAGLLGLVFWVAEGFGGIATGQATDPNTGPLLILLAACFWPASRPDATAGSAAGHSASSLAALP
jgi:hypothetical protein